MNSRQQVAELLERSGAEYVSGSSIAEGLGLTRAAVWKCIKQLEEEGYVIESSRRGYRLGAESDAVSLSSVKSYLGSSLESYSLEVFDSIDSTNTYLKQNAAKYTAEESFRSGIWHAAVAGSQSAGRGRMGRSFVSPAGSGVYLSVLLKPHLPAEKAVSITTAAAVAACLAIERCTGEEPQIKWVNDVFLRGKKTCGILTEASIDLESGGLDWAVMGIGLNVYEPEGGFPEELKDIAGPICLSRKRDMRSRLAAEFLKAFRDIASDLEGTRFSEEYKRRSFLIGQDINVIRSGLSRPAKALDIDCECRLIVRYEDGSTEALSSGEVSVRQIKNLKGN